MKHAWKWGLALSEWELAGERRELLQTFTHALVAADDRPRSDVEWSGVFIEMDAAEAYYVGSYLVRLDRELRRTVTQAKAGRIPIFETLSAMTEWRLRWISYEGEERDLPSSGRRPRPVVPTAGGLRLVAAEQGSCLLLLEALGMLQTLLTSQPVDGARKLNTFGGEK